MSAAFVYLLLRQLLQMLTQLARDGGAKDVELLILHRQVAVLGREVHRPDRQPADRVVFAALSRLLPRPRWAAFFVTPSHATSLAPATDRPALDASAKAIQISGADGLLRVQIADRVDDGRHRLVVGEGVPDKNAQVRLALARSRPSSTGVNNLAGERRAISCRSSRSIRAAGGRR